jgi:UDP-3-O-[3-hydroxymyristoyl] glucosamine N-acyltransferase
MAANLINQLSTANTFQHWLGATTSLVGTANLLTNGNGESFFANTRLIIGGTAANVSLNVETGATINVLTSEIANTVNLEAREVVFTGNLTSKTDISMNTGTGTFQTGEIVFQGPDDTLANANVTAIVYNWNTTSNVLSLIQVAGEFTQNANTYGQTSSAIWTTINTASGFTFSFPNVAIPSNVNVERDLFVDGNTRITGNTSIIGDLVVSGNLTLDTIGFDDLSIAGSGSFGNTLSVTGATTLSNVTVLGNVAQLNVSTTSNFGGDVNVTGNTYISGDLTVGGNITLDAVGFDDLQVSGLANIGNTLTVGSDTTLGANLEIAGTSNTTGNATFVNAEVTGTLTAEFLTGAANTQIQTSLQAVEASALAFSIALG